MKKKKEDLTIIELKNVVKSYDGKPVLKNVSLNIKKGEFVTLLGPSGCGKTTTLRIISGFEKPNEGVVLFNGEDITDLPPYERPFNTVFQKYALFPHLNVYKNIAFGLKLKRVPDGTTYTDKNGDVYDNLRKLTKQEIDEKVKYVLKLVDLEDYGYRHVSSLSGGQQQRVAIARAIVNEPEVLLLDEPLGALDLKMRKDMQIELKKMHEKLGITFIYVTHDQEEALTMSNTIVVMRDGIIQQIGTPQKIYDEPANEFVADFVGESNLFSGIMKKDKLIHFVDMDFECVDKGFKKNEPVDVIIRPEDIKIVGDDEALFKAVVTSCVFKGDHFQTLCELQGIDENEKFEFMVHDNVEVKVGSTIGLYIKPFDLHIMRKARLINEYETEIVKDGFIDIAGNNIEVDSTLEVGTRVKAIIDFDDIEIMDDEVDGMFGGEIVSNIYKGSYYQVIVKTDDYYNFFIDTDDEWMKGDRVGLVVPKDKIKLEVVEVEVDKNESET